MLSNLLGSSLAVSKVCGVSSSSLELKETRVKEKGSYDLFTNSVIYLPESDIVFLCSCRFHDVYLVLLDTVVEMSPNLQCHVHLGSFPFRAMLLVQNVKLVKPVLTPPRHQNIVLMELTVPE